MERCGRPSALMGRGVMAVCPERPGQAAVFGRASLSGILCARHGITTGACVPYRTLAKSGEIAASTAGLPRSPGDCLICGTLAARR